MLSRDNHNRKIRTTKRRTDVGKYSFVNRTLKSWNQLPASLLASFRRQLNTFRKRVMSKEFKWGMSINKWSYVKCSDVEWTDVIYVKCFCFEVQWNEVSYREVPGDKSTMYISVTLYWGTRMYCNYFIWIHCTVCFNWFCNMSVCVRGGVL